MARVKISELRAQSELELNQKKDALEKDMHDLRQKKVVGQLDKPHLFKATRRQIAQINTLLKEKKHA